MRKLLPLPAFGCRIFATFVHFLTLCAGAPRKLQSEEERVRRRFTTLTNCLVLAFLEMKPDPAQPYAQPVAAMAQPAMAQPATAQPAMAQPAMAQPVMHQPGMQAYPSNPGMAPMQQPQTINVNVPGMQPVYQQPQTTFVNRQIIGTK